MSKTKTPWGNAELVDQVTVPQRAGAKRFSSVFEVLETDAGERLLRIAYSTDGTVRRGPVTLRPQDVDKLRKALGDHPALAEALGLV